MGWLRQLFARRRRYKELSESIREHLEEKIADLMDRGMTREQAQRAARREFGNVTQIEECSREVWQWPTLESALADIRFALRQLLRSPAFTVTAVTTLALGIAVNATMFSLVSAFLLPHLPGRDPQNVVVPTSINPDATFQASANPVSAPNYVIWASDKHLFSEVAAADEGRTGSLSGPGQQPEAITYAAVTANYFSVFGVVPQLGRAFLVGEDQAGRDHVVILSHGLWERRYGSDPSIVGKTVRFNREDYRVAGIMPADFRHLGFTPQLWAPITFTKEDRAPNGRRNRFLYVFGRLAPGVTLMQGRAQLEALAEQAQRDFPAIESRWGATIRTLPEFLIYNFGIRPAITILMAIVAFVLLIACANVAGLLLARAVGRQKELAIRMSLGATRVRLMRQLVTEGLVIALAGGGIGLGLTYSGIQFLRAALTFNEAISAMPVRLDSRVLVFTVAVSLTAALLSSVAPAIKASRTSIHTDLKNETRSASGRGHNRLRVVLVGGEIAIALFLLIGSGLLIRGVYLIDHQKLGFDHDHLMTAGIGLDQARYPDAAKQEQFVRNLITQLRQIPGVTGTAVTSDLPASGFDTVTFHIKDQPATRANEQHTTADVVVTPEFFEIIGVPVLSGRGLTDRDDGTSPRVVLVNQQFVHKYFPDRDPIGKQIQLDVSGSPSSWSEIVGVVGDMKSYSQDTRFEPQVFEAYEQRPVGSFSVMLRTSVDPTSLTPSLRQAAAQLDSELPLLRIMSLDTMIDLNRHGNPLFAQLLTTFAVLALLLSALGIYGLIAYSVGQRTQEIGIRLALGAKASDISRMILRDGLKVALIGSAIGFVVALPLPKVFASVLEGDLSFSAPFIYPLVLAVMLIVVFCSTVGPANYATRVNPTVVLHTD
jgi:putative ABC transport system permease protein